MVMTCLVCHVIEGNSWVVTLDILSAYWHVSIHYKFQNLLGFRVGNQAFKFRAVPCGLNIALKVFTKLCMVIIKELRQKTVKIFAYLEN